MIKGLYEKGQKMALVSRTDAPPIGKRMLELLDWNQYFPYQEIYPGKKTTHFAKIQKDSGIAYSEMLFFDDEHRNIRDMSAVGVTCLFLKEPMSQEVLDRGFDMFAKGLSDR
ncbi:putative Magnesium-dependent phosphatase 1 [Hypsibius exemplaris]|uniref:Magnesium-dependent phosphatase 1 n=1 Tax=Hypsibius exemplaris TaxID=2072580 RepID=A0A9X6NS46_HYPEX|nr:putative Magnesium-dependent phosphatase 1 [Hypsibius exemplaris]